MLVLLDTNILLRLILTFNMSDFSRFVAISPIDPSRV